MTTNYEVQEATETTTVYATVGAKMFYARQTPGETTWEMGECMVFGTTFDVWGDGYTTEAEAREVLAEEVNPAPARPYGLNDAAAWAFMLAPINGGK